MKTFWQIINEATPPAPPPASSGPSGGGMSALPGGGMGGPPLGGMGGGMPPMGGGGLGGGLGGMGMDPMAGGQQGAGQPNIKVKPYSVWSVLSKILDNEPIKNKKISGQTPQNMIQNTPPNQMGGLGTPPEQPPV